MQVTAVDQMGNDDGPSVTENVGTGLADAGCKRKRAPRNDTPTSILSPSLLSHRDGRLVQLGALDALLRHLLQRDPDPSAKM